MKADRRFHKWQYQVHELERHVVFPDGCRDLLIRQGPDGPPDVILTSLDLSPRVTLLQPGTEITGYRLRPGAYLPPQAMATILVNRTQAEAILNDTCGGWSDLDDTIMALTLPGTTVVSVAKAAGVSPRTMQRHFLAQNLPPPDFWRQLARGRRAVRLLASSAPLAGIACDCGFSDQAHMTRDLLRWFGATPAQLRRNPLVLDQLGQPALGNWTGEQISTR